jgi:NADP-dependent 3-hydroxy acid dehydrogenase YdfG
MLLRCSRIDEATALLRVDARCPNYTFCRLYPSREVVTHITGHRAARLGGVRLAGAITIVTGASHGIGRATALALAARGATVVAAGLHEADLAGLADQIGGSHLSLDVRDPAHAEDLVKHAVDRYSRVDVVVANAGIGHAGAVADMTAERLCDLVDINVRAPLLLARAALPGMIERRQGAIVLVSSIAGRVPRSPNRSARNCAAPA